MSDQADPSAHERMPLVTRIQSLARSVIEPKPVSGWLALLSMLSVVRCALLSFFLFRLGLAQSARSWQLFAFAAMFLSGGMYTLAYVLPKPFAGVASRAGLVTLAISVVWVKLASGA